MTLMFSWWRDTYPTSLLVYWSVHTTIPKDAHISTKAGSNFQTKRCTNLLYCFWRSGEGIPGCHSLILFSRLRFPPHTINCLSLWIPLPDSFMLMFKMTICNFFVSTLVSAHGLHVHLWVWWIYTWELGSIPRQRGINVVFSFFLKKRRKHVYNYIAIFTPKWFIHAFCKCYRMSSPGPFKTKQRTARYTQRRKKIQPLC